MNVLSDEFIQANGEIDECHNGLFEFRKNIPRTFNITDLNGVARKSNVVITLRARTFYNEEVMLKSRLTIAEVSTAKFVKSFTLLNT